MDALNLVFCILCIIAGALTSIGGVLWMVAVANFVSVVLGIYLIIFGLYIIVVEIFMPARLQGWLAFYCTWAGKAIFYIFIGVLLIIPGQVNNIRFQWFFIVAAIYDFVLAVVLIILQILAAASVHSRSTSHSIIVVTSSKSSLQQGLASSESS